MHDPSISRRSFLERAVTAAAALTLSPVAAGAAQLARKGPAQRVVVVGAGLAGLAAAWELAGAGHDVVVLEARTRAGGRIRTLREPFSDGLYAEAGGIFVHDNHDWTLHYVERFGLELDPVAASAHAGVAHVRGRRLAMEPGQPVDWPHELTPEERQLGRDGMWKRYAMGAAAEVGDSAAADWPQAMLADYDAVTFAELLRRRGASPGAVELLGLGFPDNLGDGAETYSALNMLGELARELGMKRSFTIRGGNDLLPGAFAARLADRIRYGAPVLRIEQDGGGVRAVHDGAAGPVTVSGDRLVMTLPFSVLRRVEVSPPFSSGKREAIERMAYTSVTRVYLQMRERFWLAEGLSGQVLTDLPMRGLADRTASQPGPRGILESFRSGRMARAAAELAEPERIEATLADAERAHPAIRRYFEGGATYAWDDDPWARGGYLWWRPGEMFTLRPHVATVEGRIHFAGEHASQWPGWMQGALESGVRAAREINDAPAHPASGSG